MGYKLGHVITEKTRKKMSRSAMGHIVTKEARTKMREAKLKNPTRYWLEKKFSEEHKKKIGLAKKGQEPWNKDKKGVQIPTEATKKKTSEAMKKWHQKFGFSEKTKKRIGKGNKGKIHSPEVTKRQVASRMKNSEWHRNFGVLTRPFIKVKATKPELKLFGILDELDINYKPDHLMYNKFFVDAYIPDKNIILEVDGRYWHSLPKQQLKDKSRDAYLKACGYKVYRFWEDDFDKQKISNFILKGGE